MAPGWIHFDGAGALIEAIAAPQTPEMMVEKR
jgi:hypothetical protein